MPYKDKEKAREYGRKHYKNMKENGVYVKMKKEEKKYYDAKYRQRNKDERALYQKDYQRRKLFGITYDYYQEMNIKQGGVCAICGQKESRVGWELNVDHNHITGKVRGLLCSKCNHALGLFQDSIVLLKIATKYLEDNSEKE